MQCKPWVEIWLVLCTLCVWFFCCRRHCFVTVTWGDLVFHNTFLYDIYSSLGSGDVVFRCRGNHLQSCLRGGSLWPLDRPLGENAKRWAGLCEWEPRGQAESRPEPIRREMHMDFHPVPTTKEGSQKLGDKTTPVSPSSSSGGGSSSTCGETTPPTGGSEVLQADEYIKGLLLWTVQSFSCCFNAACPVPSVEQVSYRILRPWMAQRPNWGEKHHTVLQWRGRWTNSLLASCFFFYFWNAHGIYCDVMSGTIP